MPLIRYILLFIILLNISAYSKPHKIIIAYQNTDNYPFQTQNSQETNWRKPGVLLEMFKIVERKLKIKIDFKRYPWKRALFEMKHGKIQGVFSASYKSNRLEFGRYPRDGDKMDVNRRTHYNSYSLYKRSSSNISWNGKILKNITKNICAERAYSIVDDLKKMGFDVYEVSYTSKCIELLYNKRVDAFAALELAGDSLLTQNKYQNIVKITPALKTKAYYLMFSHQFVEKYPKLSEQIWDTIQVVRDSKEMKSIYKKYFK